MTTYDAIVLAGGRGRRLGGVDKAGLVIGGSPLLDRVLSAVQSASRTVVVGPSRALPAGVLQVQEEPAGGGPVAGLAAALPLVEGERVVVLACDLPLLGQGAVTGLVQDLLAASERGPAAEGMLFVDAGGRRQPLCGAYVTGALRRAVGSLDVVAGAAMRDVILRLKVSEKAADAEETLDCDDWDDVATATRIVEGR
ncbi:MAG: molybdenum cofactor guanylyltransferase [Nocardioidaceae bacterium]